MHIDILLSSLKKYLLASGFSQNELIDTKESIEEKEKINTVLQQMINYEIIHAIDTKRTESSESRTRIVETLNNSVKDLSSTVRAITALYAAPPPLKDDADGEDIKKWMKQYKDWYSNERDRGMEIG